MAWHDTFDANVHVAAINAQGELSPSVPLFDEPNQCGYPAIVHRAGPAGGEFYVAASCTFTNTWAIRAHRVNASGEPIGTDLTIAYDAGDGHQTAPGIVDLADKLYLLFIWTDERHGSDNRDIYGRLLSLQPDLTASYIQAIPEIAPQGDFVTVTVELDNRTGLTDALGVQAIATLPNFPDQISDTQIITWSSGVCAYISATNTVQWETDVPDLEIASCQFTVQLAASDTLPNNTYLTFSTRISAMAVSPFTRTDSIMVSSDPQLDVRLDAPAAAHAGDSFTYTLSITNGGSLATNLDARLDIPLHTQFVAGSAFPNVTPSNRTITFHWNSLAGWQAVTATFRVTIAYPITDGVLIPNFLTLTAHPGPITITRRVTTVVQSDVDFSTSVIRPNHAIVTPSEQITYTVYVTHSGTWTATRPYFQARIPAYTTLVTQSLAGSGCISMHVGAAPYISCTLGISGVMRVGANDQHTFRVRVDNVLTNGYPIVLYGGFHAANLPTPYLTRAMTVTVQSSPRLQPTWYAPDNYREICDGLPYSVRLSNRWGNENATNVVLTVSVQSPVSTVLSSNSHSVLQMETATTTTGIYTMVVQVGRLPAQSTEYQWVRVGVNVRDLITDYSVITATFWVDSDQTTPFSQTITRTIRSLCLDKWSPPNQYYVTVGELHTYNYTVRNQSTADMTGVRLDDKMPGGVELIDDTDCPGVENTNGCLVGSIPQGDAVTKTLTAHILPLPRPPQLWQNNSYINNDARAWIAGDTHPVTHVMGYDTIRARVPNFEGSWMIVEPLETPADTVYAERLTYTLYLYNNGWAAATGAQITLTAPQSTTIVACPGALLTTTQYAVWHESNIPSRAPARPLSCAIQVTEPLISGTLLTGRAVIGASAQLAYTITKQATAIYYSLPQFDFQKRVTPAGPTPPNQLVTYTIMITNSGDAHATNVVITDTDLLGGYHEWPVGRLEVGGNATYSFSIYAPAQGAISGVARSFANQAFVTSTETGGWIPSTVASNSVVQVSKTARPAWDVHAGDPLTWTIFVTNTSTSPITDVHVVDRVPLHTTCITATDGGVLNGSTVEWTTPVLSGNTALSYTFVVRVNVPLDDKTMLHNYVYGVSSCSECASFIPGNPVDVRARSEERLFIVLSASPVPTVEVGVAAHYTLTVTNTGGTHARNASITITLPSGMTDVTCGGGAVAGGMCLWTNVFVPVSSTRAVTLTATPALTTPNRTDWTWVPAPQPPQYSYGALGGQGPATRTTSLTQTVVAPVILSTTQIVPQMVITPGWLIVGRAFTVTWDIANTGDAPLRNPSVVYAAPAGARNIRAVSSPNGADVWPGYVHRWVFSGLVGPLPDYTTLTHTLTLSATNIPAERVRILTTTAINTPDLSQSSLVLTNVGALSPVGNAHTMTLVYNAVLRNTGTTTATAVSVEFIAPAGEGVRYVEGSLRTPTGWSTSAMTNGFSIAGGVAPTSGVRVLTFTVQVNVMSHTLTSTVEPRFELRLPPLTLDLRADRHPQPWPRIRSASRIYDTPYRPQWCALLRRNDSANMPLEYINALFGVKQTYSRDAQHIVNEITQKAGEGGICEGLALVSGGYIASAKGNEFGLWPNTSLNNACTLYQQEEIWQRAVKWQAAQASINIMRAKRDSRTDARTMVRILTETLALGDGHDWQNNPIILGLEQNMTRCAGDSEMAGHAVLPYRVVLDGKWAWIFVYDSNHPDYETSEYVLDCPDCPNVLNRFIMVDMETDRWYYPLGYTCAGVGADWQGTHFHYVRLDDYLESLMLPTNLESEYIRVNGIKMGWNHIKMGWNHTGWGCQIDESFDPDGAFRYIPASPVCGNSLHVSVMLTDDNYIFTTSVAAPTQTNYLELYAPQTSLLLDTHMSTSTLQREGVTFTLTSLDTFIAAADSITASLFRRGWTPGYTYTMNYDFVGGPLRSQDSITFSTRAAQETPDHSDQFWLILNPAAASSLTYTLEASWDWTVSGLTGTWPGAFSSGPMIIDPSDRHVLFVSNREYIEASVICIDKGNNGDFDTCMNIGAHAIPPASSDPYRGAAIYKHDLITYVMQYTNTADTPLKTAIELHAPAPTFTHLYTPAVCAPVGCAVGYDITDTTHLTAVREITAAYHISGGLQPGDSLVLTYTVRVTGSVGDVIEMLPWGKTELTPPSYPTSTLYHQVYNRAPLIPSDPHPIADEVEVTLTHPLTWYGSDLDDDPVTYTVRWKRVCPGALVHSVVTTTRIVTPADVLTPAAHLMAGEVYTWRVEATDGRETVTGPTWRFTTVNRPPDVPTAPFPLSGTVGVPLNIMLTWRGNDPDGKGRCGPLRYTIVLTGRNLLPGRPNPSPISYTTTSTSYLASLQPHVRYSWRIIAWDGLTSTVGPTWVFTTVNRSPTVGNFAPPHRALSIPTDAWLRWQVRDLDRDRLMYTVSFGLTPTPPVVYMGETAPNANTTISTSLSYHPQTMLTNTTYYWAITVTDGISVACSDVLSFTTDFINRPPYTPEAIAPLDGAREVTLTQPLQWMAGDSNSDMVTYTVTLRRLYPPSLVGVFTITSAEFTLTLPISNLARGASYSWQVAAQDPFNPPVTGELWRFSTINRPPTATLPVTPAHQATGAPVTQTLISWTGGDDDSPAGNTLAYTLVLTTPTGVQVYPVGEATSYNHPTAWQTATTYIWRVLVSDHISPTASQVFTFHTSAVYTTNHPPYTPTAYSPANGASVPVNQSFRWRSGDPDKRSPLWYTIVLQPLVPFAPRVTGVATSTTFDDNGYVWVTFTPSQELRAHTVYSWQVFSSDGVTITPGDVYTFTTQNRAPYPPACITPTHGSTQRPLGQPLCWSGGDPDWNDIGNISYTLRVCRDGLCTVTPTMQTCYTPTFQQWTTATLYTWVVTATDGYSATQPSAWWSFSTYNRPPLTPTVSAPPDGDPATPITQPLIIGGGDPDGKPVTYTITILSGRGEMTTTVIVTSAGWITYDMFLPWWPHTDYTWIVTATDNLGIESVGAGVFHTANRAPHTPTNPNYGDPLPECEPGAPLTATLTFTGGDGDDPYEYDLRYIIAFGVDNPPPVAATTTMTRYDPGYQLLTNTRYYWIVTATDGFSSAVGALWCFTTTLTPLPNLPPYTPTAPFPADLSTDVPLTVTLTWGPTSLADPNKDRVTYTVFSSTETTLLYSRAVTMPVFDPGRLITGATYFWRVDATDGRLTTRGPVWSFTTTLTPQANRPPDAPSSPVPPDGAENVPTDQILAWRCSDANKDPLMYTVIITRGDTFWKQEETATEWYNPGRLAPDTRYSWRVIVADDRGGETIGPQWYFTTTHIPSPNHCPSTPTLLLPTNGAIQVPQPVKFCWKPSVDDDRDTIFYRLTIGPDWKPPQYFTSDACYTLTGLNPGKRYYWDVEATDGDPQCHNTSPNWSFVTAVPTLPTPVNISPLNGAENVPLDQNLDWDSNAPDGAYPVTFTLAFGTVYPPPVVISATSTSYYEPGQLCPHTRYYWIITATDGVVVNRASGSFTTLNHAPNAPAPVSPANDATTSLSPTLTWTGGDADESLAGCGERVTYTLTWGTSNPPTRTVVTTQTTYRLTGLSPDTTYYWRVISATDGVSTTAGFALLRFTTAYSLAVLRVEPRTVAFTTTLGNPAPISQPIRIFNDGDGELTWRAQIAATSPFSSHLSLAPLAGTAPATIVVSVNPLGLAVGTYAATATISGVGEVENSPQQVTIVLYVGARLYLPILLRNYWDPMYEREPNNLMQDSNPIECNTIRYGAIPSGTDEQDYFAFGLAVTRTVEIWLEGPQIPPGVDYDLAVYGCSPDKCPNPLGESTGDGVEEHIGPLILSPPTPDYKPYNKYYIRVIRMSEQGSSSLYSLRLACRE